MWVLRRIWRSFMRVLAGDPGPRNIDEHYETMYGPKIMEGVAETRRRLGLPAPENWW